jgi:hypothetical protein
MPSVEGFVTQALALSGSKSRHLDGFGFSLPASIRDAQGTVLLFAEKTVQKRQAEKPAQPLCGGTSVVPRGAPDPHRGYSAA